MLRWTTMKSLRPFLLLFLIISHLVLPALADQQFSSHLHPQRFVPHHSAAPVVSDPGAPLDLQRHQLGSIGGGEGGGVETTAAGHQNHQQQRRSAPPTQQRSTSAAVPTDGGGSAVAARTNGYVTDRIERQCSAPASPCDLAGAGPNFNPALSGGTPGYPGIKGRLNMRAFQYLSGIAGGVLNYYIKRARLPNISQCIPQVSGCINVYNLYVSRYRCPQRVTVYPAPPNQIVLDVQNLDIGVTGNLGGQIVILLPLALFGIIQVNAHQISVRVAVYIERSANGCPQLRVASCAASVGYVDVYIQNGGLIGDIANSQFRGKISEMVRQAIPGQLCQRLPQMLDEQLNSKLCDMVPQLIPLSKLLQIAINAFGLGNLLGGTGQCPASCQFIKRKVLAQAAPNVNATVVVPQASVPQIGNNTSGKTTSTMAPTTTQGTVNSGNTNQKVRALAAPSVVSSGASAPPRQQQRRALMMTAMPIAPFAPHAVRPVRSASLLTIARRRRGTSEATRADRATASDSGRLAFVDPGENLCANCPSSPQESPLSFLSVIVQSMDLSKLDNIYLNIQLLNTYATNHDFTIEVNGGFSVCGRGCTPFGAFPMQFPSCVGCKMVEVLISDFTINSLFYHLHNVGFIRIRIGPETPKFGDLLKTTCSSDEEEELEDHGVETEDGAVLSSKRKRMSRVKRQDAGDLTSLGICLGDILPAVREQYPDQRVYIIISTQRAPSVLLSGRNGGLATLDFVINADFYIQSSNQHVGTIRIASVVDVTVRPQGNRITGHADIVSMRLTDVGNRLGLPQDALDNLGTLGKDLMLKAANDALEKGSALPSGLSGVGGLPITIVDPEVHILDHALLIQADFIIDVSQIGGCEPC